MTAIQMGGLFLGGIIGDRFDKRMICTLCMLGHFVGLMALSWCRASIGLSSPSPTDWPGAFEPH